MLVQLLEFLGSLSEHQYAIPSVVFIVIYLVLRSWADGAKTDRDRNMHGRVVLLTGILTPIGAEVMDQLARKGAQIIALVPSLEDPVIQELIPAIRTTTNNQLIYAEECDLSSAKSIRQFCAKLIQPQPSMDGQGRPEPSRLDAVITMHEYPPNVPEVTIGSSPATSISAALEAKHLRASAATFLIYTLILPSLLRAPSDRDIRFINVVNPLYAAAVPTFDPLPLAEKTVGSEGKDSKQTAPSPQSRVSRRRPLFTREGTRSLRSIIWGRHLQRVYDALRAAGEKSEQRGPLLDPTASGLSSVSSLYKGSNIISASVSPGYHSTYARELFAVSGVRRGIYRRVSSLVLQIVLTPFVFVFTKSARAASQTILHTLFLPHPMKTQLISEDAPSSASSPSSASTTSKEPPILKPGRLYRDNLPIVLPGNAEGNLIEREDVGRAVWETYEAEVKKWEEEEKATETAEANGGNQKAQSAS
ncbi:hypothetical protein DL93DRAFT_1839095 [Clavulina sp. PMI_390]|nr:hypothetical protein DL93DRAFT_1839095 [Clavulina sp. PMI_390]